MRWFNRFIQMPCFAQDAGGGGGVADGADSDAGDDGGDAGDDAGGDAEGEATEGEGDDGEHADDAAGQGGSQADDDDEELKALLGEDEEQDESRPLEERFKALRKSNNKLRKRFGKAWPLVQTLRKQGITDVNDVVVGSRNWNALLERVGGDRKKLERFLDSMDGEDLGAGEKSAARTRGHAADDAEFDEKQFDKLWDTTTETGKFFVKLARTNHEQGKALKAAATRLDQLEGGIRNDKDTQVKSSWLGVMNAAASKIKDKDTREIYENVMKSAFFVARTKGQNIDPAALSRTVLKKLKVEPTTARIADNAAKQRMAQTNQGRPRHQAGGGQPNPARAQRETVDQVNRRIRKLA